MKLEKQQIETLVRLICSADEDSQDCDGCFGQIAEFAEAQLEGVEVCEARQAIERHLQQCPCCADEYQALLDALQSLQ